MLLFSALKNNFSILDEINELREYCPEKKNFQVLFNYHFGGYAKKSKLVLDTMNHFYEIHQIPTDFIYTGKMITAFYDLLNLNYFPKKSSILLIHSGGLQGNRSLKNNELKF
jgi:1-aminocyclopropane-1-carboxylate deaminase